jgi:hypothetical protein
MLFVNSWAYVCFGGLALVIFALSGFKRTASPPVITARIFGALCGLAIIFFGIWMNLR